MLREKSGAQAMLDVLHAVMESAASQGAVQIAMDALTEELEDLLGSGEGEAH